MDKIRSCQIVGRKIRPFSTTPGGRRQGSDPEETRDDATWRRQYTWDDTIKAIEFFEPACIGDRLTAQGDKLTNVRPRKTKVSVGAFINRENDIYNQRGELVAKVNQGVYSYNSE